VLVAQRQSSPQAREVATKVEEFLEEEGIDETAAAKLRMQDPDIQLAIMDAGTLKTGHNPSALLMSRVKKALESEGRTYGPGGSSPEERPTWDEARGSSPTRRYPSPPQPPRRVETATSASSPGRASPSRRVFEERSRSRSRRPPQQHQERKWSSREAELQAKLDEELAAYMNRSEEDSPKEERKSQSHPRENGECHSIVKYDEDRPQTRKIVELKKRRSPWRESWSWHAPLTKQPPGRQVHLPGVVQSDEGLQRWLEEDGPEHLERLGPGPLDCVDVSHNNLTDEGADTLLRFLLRRQQSTRRLKLFHNRIREPYALCEFLEDPVCGVGAYDGLGELHLSHNHVTVRMLEWILKSVGHAVRAAGGSLRPPLWIRVEHNGTLTHDAVHLTKAETLHGIRLCSPHDLKRSGCGVKHCKYHADVHLVMQVKSA